MDTVVSLTYSNCPLCNFAMQNSCFVLDCAIRLIQFIALYQRSSRLLQEIPTPPKHPISPYLVELGSYFNPCVILSIDFEFCQCPVPFS